MVTPNTGLLPKKGSGKTVVNNNSFLNITPLPRAPTLITYIPARNKIEDEAGGTHRNLNTESTPFKRVALKWRGWLKKLKCVY